MKNILENLAKIICIELRSRKTGRTKAMVDAAIRIGIDKTIIIVHTEKFARSMRELYPKIKFETLDNIEEKIYGKQPTILFDNSIIYDLVLSASHVISSLLEKLNSKTVSNDELIILSAFRYALGRKSYIVGVVVDHLLKNWNILKSQTKEIIVREIIEYRNKHGKIGMDMDDSEWQKIIDINDGELNGKTKLL